MTSMPRWWCGRMGWASLLLLLARPALAGELTVTVRDAEGRPLEDAVVYALPPAGMPIPAPRQHAMMD